MLTERETDSGSVTDRLLALTSQAVQLDATLAAECAAQAARLPGVLANAESAVRPLLHQLHTHTTEMHTVIADTADLADRISRKVRLLDADQQKVRRLLALLDDLCEVRDSAVDVAFALDTHDWELAATHIQRFLKHDVELIRRVFNKYKLVPASAPNPPPVSINQSEFSIEDDDARNGKNSSLTPQNFINTSQADLFCPPGAPDPIDTLTAAKSSLLTIISREFDAAVKSGNEASIIRFFKLFAVIDERALGLDKFSAVLASVVKRLAQDFMRGAGDADQIPTFYADILTRLFEAVASLIDKQELIVERNYGPGRLLRVIVALQTEMDIQTGIMLDSFEDRRSIARKISDINALNLANSQNKPPPLAASALDPREVDALINEIAIISARTRLFNRFLDVRTKGEEKKLAALKEAGELTSPKTSGPSVAEGEQSSVEQGSERPKELEGVFLNEISRLTRRVKELLSTFAVLQNFFLKKSIEKALKLDEHEPGSQTSSSVEDVFYIVKTSMSRTLSTVDSLTICTVLESVGRILETEYVSGIQKRVSGNIGTLETKEGKVGVLIALNNLDVSCDYITKLVKEIDNDVGRLFGDSSPNELEKIATCLATVTNYGVSFKKMLMVWVESIFTQMIKPKIRPTLLDCFKDVKYVLTDDEYAEIDAQDAFMKRFIRDFGKLISLFKSTYSARNQNQTVSYFVDAILSEWERYMFVSLKFNALGALRFDKDLRAATSFLTMLTSWSIRDKFARLNNACALLNIEGLGEVAEIVGVSAGWRLSNGDVKKVLALRTELNFGDIAQLKI
ncbi:Golgi transport complex subunit 4 [Physocladia obscura]|uniref:Conserved oligomeric Golgi complex subunit 4 n=1 Tax=Physocladia obscura TaxID=109957 RepID=A0AAD5XD63_9FUNG|nr:Golgi transport complex subunit 4 [Physocladia obscura]